MKRSLQHASHGFILVLTLIILSIMVIMVTQLFNRGRTHLYFTRTMIDREQAKLLALGGIQLAMSQLSIPPEQEKESVGTEAKKEKKDNNVVFLQKNLATLNLWQEFTLKEDIDGMNGIVKFCISSEDGKIDINQIFDFSSKKFLNEGAANNDTKKALTALFASAKKFLDNKDLFEPFEKFLKQRQYKLRDVTELLTIEEFQNVFKDNVFYEPPTSTKKEQRPVYLTDIFTIWSGQPAMNPWLLSDSIRALFTLKRSEPSDIHDREKQTEQLLKNVKSVSGDLKTVWEQSLEKLYAKEFKALPSDITVLFAKKFNAKTFSVLSYGTVGKITQKVLALIETQDYVKFMVNKLYWL
jgi:hypothetical protein